MAGGLSRYEHISFSERIICGRTLANLKNLRVVHYLNFPQGVLGLVLFLRVPKEVEGRKKYKTGNLKQEVEV